jgi:hypothetical protein
MKNVSIIIILLTLICTGCKEIHCPNFPNNLNYFPYENGQELEFANTQGDIRSFTVISKENSVRESFPSNCKCDCFVFTRIKASNNQDNINLECEINISGRERAGRFHLQNYISNTHLTEFLHKEVDVREFRINLDNYEKIEKYLEDTISLENGNNQLIKKMVFVKNKGLISYTTENEEEWNLIE